MGEEVRRYSSKDDLEGRDMGNTKEEDQVGGATGRSRTGAVLLLLAAIGTVAFSIIGHSALGLSETSASVSFAAYHRHPFTIFLTYAGGTIAGLLLIASSPMLYHRFANGPSARLRVAALFQALAGSMMHSFIFLCRY
jgi:hypothetical protein